MMTEQYSNPSALWQLIMSALGKGGLGGSIAGLSGGMPSAPKPTPSWRDVSENSGNPFAGGMPEWANISQNTGNPYAKSEPTPLPRPRPQTQPMAPWVNPDAQARPNPFNFGFGFGAGDNSAGMSPANMGYGSTVGGGLMNLLGTGSTNNDSLLTRMLNGWRPSNDWYNT